MDLKLIIQIQENPNPYEEFEYPKIHYFYRFNKYKNSCGAEITTVLYKDTYSLENGIDNAFVFDDIQTAQKIAITVSDMLDFNFEVSVVLLEFNIDFGNPYDIRFFSYDYLETRRYFYNYWTTSFNREPTMEDIKEYIKVKENITMTIVNGYKSWMDEEEPIEDEEETGIPRFYAEPRTAEELEELLTIKED